MAILDNFKRFNEKVSTGFEWFGLAAFLLMMLLTTVDVIGAKLFLRPVDGSLDLMMILQLVAMSLALGTSYITGRHVQVEFFTPLLPKLVQRINRCFIRSLMLLLFIVMTWQLFVYGNDLKLYGEVSSTIRIPLYPFTYAAAVAFIPACLAALAKWIQAIIEVFKHES
ncbi:MAG: TRAP transporter small permease [Desulfobacteraceae bacterium]|jgi:TRAP-type C4-dicarboxylate transport system permease small subunit